VAAFRQFRRNKNFRLAKADKKMYDSKRKKFGAEGYRGYKLVESELTHLSNRCQKCG